MIYNMRDKHYRKTKKNISYYCIKYNSLYYCLLIHFEIHTNQDNITMKDFVGYQNCPYKL